jgi:hypothetical protein
VAAIHQTLLMTTTTAQRTPYPSQRASLALLAAILVTVTVSIVLLSSVDELQQLGALIEGSGPVQMFYALHDVRSQVSEVVFEACAEVMALVSMIFFGFWFWVIAGKAIR